MNRYLVLFALLASVPANALELSVAGGLGRSTPSYQSGVAIETSASTALGLGGWVDWNLFPGFDAEVGLLYLPRKYTAGGSEGTLNTAFIPLMARFNAFPVLSIAGGFYYATMGAERNNGSLTGRSDYGFSTSAQAKFALAPTLKWFLDLRYLIGLKSISDPSGSPGVTAKFRDVQLWTGVSFGI